MFRPLRKFSIKPKNLTPGFQKDSYPVLAIDQTEDEDPAVFLLVADDQGNLEWLNHTEVRVVSIDD